MKKSTIEANQAADDIRNGLDDAALMKKYGLSARGLQSLFKKLVSAGVLKESEIQTRTSETATSLVVDILTPEEEGKTLSVQTSNRRRVIAVSQDPALLSFLRDFLELRDISVIACADADLDLFRHIRPHLALVDIDADKVSSEDLFISFRQAEEFFPVVAVVEAGRQFPFEKYEDGIYDIVEKPINSGQFVSAVSRALEYCDLVRFKRDHDRKIEELQNLLHQLEKTQDVSILTLAKMAEARVENGGSPHLKRIQKLCRLISERASSRPTLRKILTPKFIDNLVRSCVLHDIGKAALPDSALHGTEWTESETLRQHPVFGGRALEEAAAKVGEESFFSVGKEMAYYHHEHWDGSGYPFGLPGEEIPLSARILAIAEAYARMVSIPPDNESLSHEQACERILQGKGVEFDPELVEVFMEIEGELRKISQFQEIML